jgi:hypothetical protein
VVHFSRRPLSRESVTWRTGGVATVQNRGRESQRHFQCCLSARAEIRVRSVRWNLPCPRKINVSLWQEGSKNRRVLRECARRPARSTRKPVPKHPAASPSTEGLRTPSPTLGTKVPPSIRRAARHPPPRGRAPPRGTFKPATAVATAVIKEPRVQPPPLQVQQPPQPVALDRVCAARLTPGAAARRTLRSAPRCVTAPRSPSTTVSPALAADPRVLSSRKSLAASCGPALTLRAPAPLRILTSRHGRPLWTQPCRSCTDMRKPFQKLSAPVQQPRQTRANRPSPSSSPTLSRARFSSSHPLPAHQHSLSPASPRPAPASESHSCCRHPFRPPRAAVDALAS